jgi:hypothetical protein
MCATKASDFTNLNIYSHMFKLSNTKYKLYISTEYIYVFVWI